MSKRKTTTKRTGGRKPAAKATTAAPVDRRAFDPFAPHQPAATAAAAKTAPAKKTGTRKVAAKKTTARRTAAAKKSTARKATPRAPRRTSTTAKTTPMKETTNARPDVPASEVEASGSDRSPARGTRRGARGKNT